MIDYAHHQLSFGHHTVVSEMVERVEIEQLSRWRNSKTGAQLGSAICWTGSVLLSISQITKKITQHRLKDFSITNNVFHVSMLFESFLNIILSPF